MDIYLTNLVTGQRLRFPVVPERLNVRGGGVFREYNVLGVGGVCLPLGDELRGFSWQGILPGHRHHVRTRIPWLRDTTAPPGFLAHWDSFIRRGDKLRLLVTGSNINCDVYLKKYSGGYQGAHRDYHYHIDLVAARAPQVVQIQAGAPPVPARPAPPPPRTYTVVRGDTLWGIAQRFLGAGPRWPEIHAANRAVIGSNPHLIFPGQVLIVNS